MIISTYTHKMKLKNTEIKDLISAIGFKPQDGDKDIYFKSYSNHNDYVLKINFEQEKIEYGTKISLGDLTTCNFENSENFVVLECIDRSLSKGYSPDRLSLEYKWPMGRKEKGKLDILITDKDENAYLMIECKTWGEEYKKEKNKMQRDGGQLFSYFQQDKATQYLCLYASRIIKGQIEYINDIVTVDEQWKELNNQKEIFEHWNKNFKDNGIFEDWANAYDIEIKALTGSRLKELNSDDSGRIFNQFAEILRHNVVSDKPNAFNKILNLFICKIIDEDRNENEEVYFQWFEEDTHEKLQTRLNDLYKDGMKRFLDIEVTDYTDLQLENKLYNINEPEVKKQIQEMFQHLRLQKNPEFAFKEVYNEKSFYDNAHVVKEVVELLQPFRFRYGHKQQFLGDFFELLLSTSIKQEAGQFFTPVPIAKFIVSCFPIREFINQKIQNNEADILPTAIDYATGSGHFLTEWMDELQHIINEIETEKIRPTAQRRINGWKLNQFEWAKDYVYGIEADYRLVKTTKVSSFLNGDGEAIIIRADGLDNFKKSTDYKGKLKETSNENRQDNAQFDILIANPPYSVSAFKNTLKFGEESFELYNRLTDDSSEIECLFIERTKQLLKIGGWAGIILPSSILSNSGIYSDAREIILKYFDLKAIAEFGSSTFMATGTNTVTLFLERRSNNEWKKIEAAIKNFFDKPKEATVNGIKNAFSKYVTEVFDNLELTDYITFANKEPNNVILLQEIFNDYKTWFNSLTEIKQLKEKKAFKDKTESEKNTEIDKIFHEKVIVREQEKMLYFFLALPQQTVLIKVGEKQAEKDFIGYEFSSRRGHEGIKLYRDENGSPTTKLFDEQDSKNPKKANNYVYRSFLNEKFSIDKSLQENITLFDTIRLIDFKKINFDKSISLSIKKKVLTQNNSKWDLIKVQSLCNLGRGRVINKEFIKNNQGEFPVYSSQTSDEGIFGYINTFDFDGEYATWTTDGANAGTVFYRNGKFNCTNVCGTIKAKDKNINLQYLTLILNKIAKNYVNYVGNPKLMNEDMGEISIPLPPKELQEKIILEISVLEQREKIGREKSEKFKKQMANFYNEIKPTYPVGKITNHIQIIGGGTPSTKEMTYWNGHIPWLSVVDFNNEHRFVNESQKKITEKGLKNSSTKYLNSGDIIISARGTVGAIAQLSIPMTFNQSCYGLRGINGFDNGFLYYVLKYEIQQLKDNASGAIFDAITTKTFESIFIPIPKSDEQKSIVSEFEKLEHEISSIKKELDKIYIEKEKVLKKYLE